MSHTGRNFVFAYAFLVVLPLLGLAGVLRSGRHLSAPPAIDGLWSFQTDPAEGVGCGFFLGSVPDKLLSISQSGKNFVLSTPSEPTITGTGMVERNAISASLISPKASFQNGCRGGAREFRLVAKVERQASSSILTGTLSAANCSSCATVPFKAQRLVDATPKVGR
jgi:hypothetical protein